MSPSSGGTGRLDGGFAIIIGTARRGDGGGQGTGDEGATVIVDCVPFDETYPPESAGYNASNAVLA